MFISTGCIKASKHIFHYQLYLSNPGINLERAIVLSVFDFQSGSEKVCVGSMSDKPSADQVGIKNTNVDNHVINYFSLSK